jgi:hypothetical protein
MNAIVQASKALLGLFFDDGSLAIAIVTLLVALALLAHAGLTSPLITMVLLVGGTLTLLLENVIRTARRDGR